MSERTACVILVSAIAFALSGCTTAGGPDIESGASFDKFPVYWVGESFEGHDLKTIEGTKGPGPGVVLIYGDCTPEGGLEPTCTPPLQIQIFPLCFHLDTIAVPPHDVRVIRGAPLGAQDGAPVILTRRTQVKVYRGEGTDAGVALRALSALRSLNSVRPVISATEGIPPPPRGVLGGKRGCRH